MASDAHPTGFDNDSTFPQFTELPQEIRLMTWKEALPGPRIVHLERDRLSWYPCTRVWSDKAVDECNKDGRPAFFDVEDGTYKMRYLSVRGLPGIHYGPENPCCGLRSDCAPPILLYVCHESYEVTCQFYSRAFRTEHALPTTWFDFQRDILYIDWNISRPIAEFHLPDLGMLDPARVENLVLFDFISPGWISGPGQEDGFEYESYEQWMCDVLRVFHKLQKLTIVIAQGHDQMGSGELVFRKAELFSGLFHVDICEFTKTARRISGDLKTFRDFFSLSLKPFDNDRLNIYKNRVVEQGLSTWDTLPEIDYQIVTTPEYGAQLERVETMFEELPPSQRQAIVRGDVNTECIIQDGEPLPIFRPQPIISCY